MVMDLYLCVSVNVDDIYIYVNVYVYMVKSEKINEIHAGLEFQEMAYFRRLKSCRRK